MKIPLRLLSEEEVEFTAAYDGAMFEFDVSDVVFSAPVAAVFHVMLNDTTCVVRASLATELTLICGRCLEERYETVQKDPTWYYQVAPKDDSIDVTENVREELYFSLPIKPLCCPDCKGLCLQCGQNLNKGECTHVSTKKTTFKNAT